MRIVPLSECEKAFICSALSSGHRLDGRKLKEYRKLKVFVGKKNGTALAELGNTIVFANVAAEVVEPRASDPAAGSVFVNVELSSLVGRFFDGLTCSSVRSEICRLLERCVKESGCIDVESLCIIRGKKVYLFVESTFLEIRMNSAWRIRVNVDVLNFDGSVVDCATVAVFAALKRFKRPVVTVVGTDFKVHLSEKTEQLCLYHTPLCFTYGFKDKDHFMVVDPNEEEAQVVDHLITVAVNLQRQICLIHSGKPALVEKNMVLRCIDMATQRVSEVSDVIKDALQRAEDPKAANGFDLIVNRRPSELRAILRAHANAELPDFEDVNMEQQEEDSDIEVLSETDEEGEEKVVKPEPMAKTLRIPDVKPEPKSEPVAVAASNQAAGKPKKKKRKKKTKTTMATTTQVDKTKVKTEPDVSGFLEELEEDFATLTSKDFGYEASSK